MKTEAKKKVEVKSGDYKSARARRALAHGGGAHMVQLQGESGTTRNGLGTAAGPPVVVGLKDQILGQFTPVNRYQFF